MSRYVALLRGINVGGNNLIKMTELKACLQGHGFDDVATYIQSGNVVFTAGAARPDDLARRMESALLGTFNCDTRVIVRSLAQMRAVVGRAPDGFGSQPGKRRYDVIFLMPSVSVSTAIKSVLTKPGVDEAHAGRGVLYFSRLISKASRSRLSKIVTLPIYKSLTIRNWNTTTTLLNMMMRSK